MLNQNDGIHITVTVEYDLKEKQVHKLIIDQEIQVQEMINFFIEEFQINEQLEIIFKKDNIKLNLNKTFFDYEIREGENFVLEISSEERKTIE